MPVIYSKPSKLSAVRSKIKFIKANTMRKKTIPTLPAHDGLSLKAVIEKGSNMDGDTQLTQYCRTSTAAEKLSVHLLLGESENAKQPHRRLFGVL